MNVDELLREYAAAKQQLEGCAIVARDYQKGVDYLKEFGYGEQWKLVAICRQSLDASIANTTSLSAQLDALKQSASKPEPHNGWAPCSNCGHANSHTSLAGEVNDRCDELGCNCAYYAPGPKQVKHGPLKLCLDRERELTSQLAALKQSLGECVKALENIHGQVTNGRLCYFGDHTGYKPQFSSEQTIRWNAALANAKALLEGK